MEVRESKHNHFISYTKRWLAFLNREVTIYFEFSFNIRNKKLVSRRKKDVSLIASLVFGSFLTILFLIVGLIGGWTAREYMMNYREIPTTHPEMFDENGNLIPDQVIAFNFENYDNEDNSEEDDND